MQSEKQANYNVKVRQYNYSFYSLINKYCVENWDLSKEFLEDQSKDLREKFDPDMMIELEKFNSACITPLKSIN